MIFGTHRSHKIAEAPPRTEKPKPTLVASAPPPAAKPYRVADALAGLKIDRRSRVELSKVRQIYVEECKRRGCDPVGGDAFTDEELMWCKANGVELQGIDGRVFMLGVKMVA